jgi:hypothetical protein
MNPSNTLREPCCLLFKTISALDISDLSRAFVFCPYSPPTRLSIDLARSFLYFTYMSMAGSRPATPASPKVHRARAQEPGVPLYGCGKPAPRIKFKPTSKAHAEHLRLLISKSPDSASQTIWSYKKLLRVIFDNTPIISQTSKSPDGLPITSLTPNYLCLQCSATCTAKDRPKHGALTKHRLCMLLFRLVVGYC